MEGKIVAIHGVVVDLQFDEKHTPKVYDALETQVTKEKKLVLEVEAVLGGGMVRCVAMGDTYGLRRGMVVKNTGSQIQVPVGEPTLGRLFNVLGEAIDENGDVQ